ncbi:MAG: hypothetical protein JSS81_25175 [Acidobacteria bacterium]|nr:hypothetical protein [Acidobacteriota bacterium]
MRKVISIILTAASLLVAGCGPNGADVTANRPAVNSAPVNSAPVNAANSAPNANANASVTSSDPNATIPETAEPERYRAVVQLKFEATGRQQTASMPPISANVGRDGADRRMEFNLPGGEQFVYLDKGGTNYLIMPKTKQYAILDKQSLGFEVRQLMMPEQIVAQVKTVRGVERVGEENVNGRQTVKYRYGSVADTKTNAGRIETESFFLIDKETGLPIHSETVSRSQNGSVEGLSGLRIVTEISDINTEPAPELFAVPPADYKKIDPAQVKAQVDLIFNSVALLINQAVKSAQSAQPTP